MEAKLVKETPNITPLELKILESARVNILDWGISHIKDSLFHAVFMGMRLGRNEVDVEELDNLQALYLFLSDIERAQNEERSVSNEK